MKFGMFVLLEVEKWEKVGKSKEKEPYWRKENEEWVGKSKERESYWKRGKEE